jgi:hypothetical protein
MNKRREVSNVKFLGSLLVLAGLIISLGFPAQTKVRAEKIKDSSETVSETTADSKKIDYGKMPLLFEQNKGQTERAAKFVSRGSGYTLYLAETEAVFSLKVPLTETETESLTKAPKTAEKTKSDVLKMQFVGANAKPTLSGEAETITKTNYYIGKKRFENVPNYARVNYKNLYQGIDAVFYGNANNQLEYDFTVAPNIETSQIKLNFDGAEKVSIDESGNLIVKTANAELVQQKPIAFQSIDGERHEVEVKYVIREQSQIPNPKSQISFALGEYDKSQPLTIDPALSYLTYIGGTGFDNTRDIAVDSGGNAYITGETLSLNFHGQTRSGNNGEAAYVAKINEDGTNFDYVTILEGTTNDGGFGVAVDADGNAYVTGIAGRNFPTTSGAFDTVHGILSPEDAFATKLNSTGEIVYSTYLGGTDQDGGSDIAVDPNGKAYIVGETYSNSAFPLKNKYQNCGIVSPFRTFDSLDAFLTVFDASGSDITYSSCIGNTVGVVDASDEEAIGVALDSSNNVYMTGFTKSNTFKTKNAAQSEIGGGIDGFVAKFIPTQSGDASVAFATFLGGGGTDKCFGIAVDSSGQAHVTGVTGSFDFPLQNAFDSTNQINEAFVTRYSSTGALNFSSFLGGSNQEEGANIAVDNRGSVYIGGSTLSDDFPLALPFQNARRGNRDAFITKIRIGTGVISSTLLGGNGNENAFGIAVKGNNIFVAGPTESNNLLTTSGVIKPTSNASATNFDGFVAKILDTRLDSVGVFRPASTFILTQSITNVVPTNATQTAQLAGQKGVSGDWNGDGIDTIGSFSNGVWKIRNANFPLVVLPAPFGATTINFGSPGDLPIVGDWNNDGIDTPGVYRPSTGQFFLTNSTATTPPVDITAIFGVAEDLPVAGDWNGDGFDSVGVFRPSAGQFFLTDDNVLTPSIDQNFFFGIAGDLPTAGDWNGNGIDTVGVWRTATTEFFLTNDNVNISNVFLFGQINTDQPIAGDWDGRPLP